MYCTILCVGSPTHKVTIKLSTVFGVGTSTRHKVIIYIGTVLCVGKPTHKIHTSRLLIILSHGILPTLNHGL